MQFLLFFIDFEQKIIKKDKTKQKLFYARKSQVIKEFCIDFLK